MNAYDLIERTMKNFEERGYVVKELSKANDWFTIGDYYKKKGERHISVSVTYRHNGTAENVTVTMYIIETLNEYCGKYIAKIKIPKNASDRVLNNRIDRALSIMKTGIAI